MWHQLPFQPVNAVMFNTLMFFQQIKYAEFINVLKYLSILSTPVVLLYCTSQFSWRKTLSMKSCSFLTEESHGASPNDDQFSGWTSVYYGHTWRHLNQNQGTPSSLHGGKMPPPSRASCSTRFLRANHEVIRADLACRPEKRFSTNTKLTGSLKAILFHELIKCISIYMMPLRPC